MHALDRITLYVNEGEFVCLVGPSGCGKSTLLNVIAGLEPPDAGPVLTDGAPIRGPGRDRMVMFQEPALFPWLDVLDNVKFGLRLKPGLTDRAQGGGAVLPAGWSGWRSSCTPTSMNFPAA